MKIFLVLMLTAALTQSGCAFLGGAATGALATGAGYEIQAKRQMDKLDDDLKAREFRVASMSSANSRSRTVRSFTKGELNAAGKRNEAIKAERSLYYVKLGTDFFDYRSDRCASGSGGSCRRGNTGRLDLISRWPHPADRTYSPWTGATGRIGELVDSNDVVETSFES